MKKLSVEKIKDFVIENIIFFIMILVTVIFVASPVILRNEQVYKWISLLLGSLKQEGYKSSYIETIGALLGTFLAISGALWTQRRIDRKKEKGAVRENALIMYYDLKFSLYSIWDCMRDYSKNVKIPGIRLAEDQRKIFVNSLNLVEIEICEDWREKVASVAKYLKEDEVKDIYTIYGDLQNIKRMLSNIDATRSQQIYWIMHKYVHWEMSGNLENLYYCMLNQEKFNVLSKISRVGDFKQ